MIKLSIVLLFVTLNASAEPICQVTVCNKLERLSLNLWSHLKDEVGEQCFEISMPKSEAKVGKVLDSSSRWYQGSTFNPTKRSVTRIKKVYGCDN